MSKRFDSPGTPLRQFVARLERSLTTGDLRAAMRAVDASTSRGSFGRRTLELRRLPISSPWRKRGAAAIAEVLAYLGRNIESRSWLKPWIRNGMPDLGNGDDGVSVRARLQVVEYAYSQRWFERAAEAAADILREATRTRDVLGRGEAAYFLARCRMRQHNHDVFQYVNLALESFAHCVLIPDMKRAAQWRSGLTLLVSAHAAWGEGRSTALPMLHTARTLIGLRDPLGQAHVDHTIGTVLRSGATIGSLPSDATSSQLSEALERFDGARMVYERHAHWIHLARVLTNMARALGDTGKVAGGHALLDRARKCAKRIQDPPSRNRQIAEILMFKAWLCNAAGPSELDLAEQCARNAIRMMETAASRGVQSTTIAVESRLALGASLVRRQRHPASDPQRRDELAEAAACFNEALHRAASLRLKRSEIHAHLNLGRLFLTPGALDLRSAVQHVYQAERALRDVPSRYLSDALNNIQREMREASDVWILTADDVLGATSKGNKLKAWRETLEEWVLDRLEQEPFSLAEGAQRLGIGKTALHNRRQRRLQRKRFGS